MTNYRMLRKRFILGIFLTGIDGKGMNYILSEEKNYADLYWDKDEAAHLEFISNLAPIVLFTYNRLDHTRQTIEALKDNVYAADSEIYIYSDAPKNEKATNSVSAVREYLKTVNGFRKVIIIQREENWGLAKNIIDGVTNIIEKYGKIIVLEDDIVTSKYFLKYMNDGLKIYEDMPKVMAISGYTEEIKDTILPDTFFLPWTSCWGWATWSRTWRLFKRNPKELVERFSQDDIGRFNIDNSYDFWSQVVSNANGKLDTWAIFYYALVFENAGLVLYSHHSMSSNIGFDGSGEHCGRDEPFQHSVVQNTSVNKFFIGEIKENELIVDSFKKKYRNMYKKKSLLVRCTSFIKNEGFLAIPFKVIEKINYVKEYIWNSKQKNKCISGGGTRFYLTSSVDNCSVDISRIQIGNRCNIRGQLFTFPYAGQIQIGNDCYIGEGSRIWAENSVVIGDNVLIAHNVDIHDSNDHPIEPKCRREHYHDICTVGFLEKYDLHSKPIKIKDNAWIGFGACVMKGVTIGRNSIVAAHAVVVKDVPDNVVVAGNPAQIVRELSAKELSR